MTKRKDRLKRAKKNGCAAHNQPWRNLSIQSKKCMTKLISTNGRGKDFQADKTIGEVKVQAPNMHTHFPSLGISQKLRNLMLKL